MTGGMGSVWEEWDRNETGRWWWGVFDGNGTKLSQVLYDDWGVPVVGVG